MLEIGGSHAQRDLFQQLYLDSLVRSGARVAAQQLLEERRRFEPDGVALNRTLAHALRASSACRRRRRRRRPARAADYGATDSRNATTSPTDCAGISTCGRWPTFG